MPNDMAQEFEAGGPESPLRDLFANPPEFKDGRLTVPTGPSLGLELDEAKLKTIAP